MAFSRKIQIKTNTSEAPTSKDNSHGLGIPALAAIVISSMIGGGIYSLPQNMAQGASAGAVLLAWLITGLGIFFIANTFSILSRVKPDMTTGIYMYAREGFGSYAGFTIGWSYWLCQVCGNVGYAIITMDALNYFFPPHFAGGNTLPAIIGGSLIIWGFNWLVLRGVRQATYINTIGTLIKIVPLVLFILIMLFVFKLRIFDFDFWGEALQTKAKIGDLATQIKSTMLVTLWAFIGIEGAVVMSKRAHSQNDVGKATILGFIGCLVIYILLSLLPYGYMSQAVLADIPNPSTAGILEKVMGKGGAWLMNIGLLVSVLTSWLAWTMITAEIPQAAAEDGTFPKIFTLENACKAPSASLWITSVAMQLFLLLAYFSDNAWNTMLSITGVMVLPAYFTSCAYLWKLCEDGEFSSPIIHRSSALLTSVIGAIYALWLIYAAGIKYLLLAVAIIALGIPVYVRSRKERAPNERVFTEHEWALASAFIIIALWALYAFSRGIVTV